MAGTRLWHVFTSWVQSDSFTGAMMDAISTWWTVCVHVCDGWCVHVSGGWCVHVSGGWCAWMCLVDGVRVFLVDGVCVFI